MVDDHGMIGWAPASFLVPVDEGDQQTEDEENEQLIKQDKGVKFNVLLHGKQSKNSMYGACHTT